MCWIITIAEEEKKKLGEGQKPKKKLGLHGPVKVYILGKTSSDIYSLYWVNDRTSPVA